MRIQPINLYNNLNISPLRKQQPALQASAPDMFVKSPTFGNHKKLLPFFEGNIKYTPENVKKFTSIIDKSNLSEDVLKTLIDKAKSVSDTNSYNLNFTFNCDFLIRYANADEILDAGMDYLMLHSIPVIGFTQKNSSKVDSILDGTLSKMNYPAVFFHEMLCVALEEENLNLLKVLSKNNGQYFKKFLFYKELQNDEIKYFVEKTRESKNPAIRDLFTGENLYNILKDFYKGISSDLNDPMINAEFLAAMPKSGERNYYINDFFYENEYDDNALDALSMVPMSDCERRILLLYENEDGIDKTEQVLELMKKRMDNIVQRNGLETPENLLNCLKDKIMSEEMFTQNYYGTTLIEEIAKIPSNKDIMDELSKYPHLKDNDSYRNAAIIAAKQGNTELLKFLDSRHIHYANNLKEPIESYPKEVQEILRNAKVSDTRIFQYASSPEKLYSFLENNPTVDINTLNDNGETLLMVSASNRDLDMFEYLANRDDVDLNMIDNYGENVAMRACDWDISTRNFAKKAIEILRNQPPERFDINYVNYTPNLAGRDKSYSVLSKMFDYNGQDIIEEILKFPNIDTNFNPMNERPLLLAVMHRPNIFEQVFFHPNTDLELLSAYINPDNIANEVVDKDDLKLFNSCIDKKFLIDMKKSYDENGFLTLDEIEKLVDFDTKEKQFCHEKINVVGENIGHFLAETVVDENNPQEMKQLRSVFKKLQKCGYDFNSKDDFGVTPLAKSIECENRTLEYIFRFFTDED